LRRRKKGSGGEGNGGSQTQSTIPEETAEDMDIDAATAGFTMNISSEREERFNTAFSQHMMVNRLDQIPMNEIARMINRGNTLDPFTPAEITCLLQ
ncbi:hypothetical protein KI387_042177, partial [Taxus chinensis]